MALLPTNKDKKKIGAEDISIKDDINVELGERKYTAKERKPFGILVMQKIFLCMK